VKSMTAAAFLVLLAACTPDTGRWDKDGASADARGRDLSECRAEARRAVERDQNIDTDIMASRSTDWQNTGTIVQRRDTMRYSNIGRYEDVIAGCMKARGYAAAAHAN
jgi:hypothetical protein